MAAKAPDFDALAPLASPAFRIMWSTTLVANLGAMIQNVAAGWSMAEFSASHDMVALVHTFTTLPIMLLAIPVGALSDSIDRRLMMLGAQAFMFAVSIALTLASWSGSLSPGLLLTSTFLLSCGLAVHYPCWQASVRDLVKNEVLPAAVALNSVGFNLTRAAGPAVGGFLVAFAGPTVSFSLNAVSYLALILGLILWRKAKEVRKLPSETLGSAIWLGLRYVSLSPNLLSVLIRGFLFTLFAVIVLALLPVITREHLHAEATTYGLLLGAFGFGAILGALVSPRLRKFLSIEAITAGTFSGSALALGIIALMHSPALAAPGFGLAGACWVSTLSLCNVSTQLATPRWVVGRVLAIYQTMIFGGMAVGSWLWGLISEQFGVIPSFCVAGGLLLCGALLGRLMPMPDFPDVDLHPADRFSAPDLRLDLKPRSGPITVMIDWDIAPDDTEKFIAAMAVRRRIRTRDGARNWTLERDLGNPDLWLETYHAPNWVEYIRHNQRRTRADAEDFDRLAQLHRGPGLPRIRRLIDHRAMAMAGDAATGEIFGS